MHQKSCVIISHERFFTRFYYDSPENIMGENLFERFNLPKGIVVHKNLAERLYSIVPVLEHLKLRMMFTDVFRPVGQKTSLQENEVLAKLQELYLVSKLCSLFHRHNLIRNFHCDENPTTLPFSSHFLSPPLSKFPTTLS